MLKYPKPVRTGGNTTTTKIGKNISAKHYRSLQGQHHVIWGIAGGGWHRVVSVHFSLWSCCWLLGSSFHILLSNFSFNMTGYCVFVVQVRLAEVEQASLMSEQLSDKSSSPALPDDLSLDENSSYQLLVRDSQVFSHLHTNTYELILCLLASLPHLIHMIHKWYTITPVVWQLLQKVKLRRFPLHIFGINSTGELISNCILSLI